MGGYDFTRLDIPTEELTSIFFFACKEVLDKIEEMIAK
jgi:hypothetical protein